MGIMKDPSNNSNNKRPDSSSDAKMQEDQNLAEPGEENKMSAKEETRMSQERIAWLESLGKFYQDPARHRKSSKNTEKPGTISSEDVALIHLEVLKQDPKLRDNPDDLEAIQKVLNQMEQDISCPEAISGSETQEISLMQQTNLLLTEKTNGKKIRKYKGIYKLILGVATALSIYAGTNLYEWHKFDKYVIKNIEIAANVPSAGRSRSSSSDTQNTSSTELCMETALSNARNNTSLSKLRNTGIIWKLPITNVGTLEALLDYAIIRSREIQQFKDSFSRGEVDESYPEWVKFAQKTIHPKIFASELEKNGRKYSEAGKAMLRSIEQITKSEYGQRIANEYEALNNVVSGGTRTSGKVREHHKSLLETLDQAASLRSILFGDANEYKQAYSHVFVGYLMANMGNLDEGIKHFKIAKTIMDQYPDSKNLGIFRHTPELGQDVIKGLINSSITELSALNEDDSKYSAGWWKRLAYYNQSIGGQANPSIIDIAETINEKYWVRASYSGWLVLGLFYLAGMFAKKRKLASEYEVKPEGQTHESETD